MADCTRYKELLSGFADGELTEKEETEVRKHLDNCASCRALLTIYRSIADSAEASMKEPPEGFSHSVMSRIKDLRADASVDTVTGVSTPPAKGRRPGKPLRPIIITFVAAAACLALVFIVSPQLFSFTSSKGTSSGAPYAPAAASAASSAAYSVYDTDGAVGNSAAPKQAMKAPGSAQAESAPDYSAESSAQLMTGGVQASASAAAPGQDSSAAGQANESVTANDAPGAMPSAPTPAPAIPQARHADTVNLEKYYAVISVTGQLPDVLKGDAMTDNGDGTYAIEISVNIAEQLIAEGNPAVIGNSDAPTALAVYTPV